MSTSELSTSPLYKQYDDDYDSDYAAPCKKDSIKTFRTHFLPVVYSLVFVFGLLGNALVVCVLIQYKRIKTMTDVYLLNLAISDLLFVFSLPFWIYYTLDEWVFGNFMCKVISGIYLFGFFSGIFFIVLMSVDRYLAIVHAIFSMKARTVTCGTITSICVWLVAFIAAIPELMFNEVSYKDNHTSCKASYPDPAQKWKLFCTLEINILGLVIPSAVMVFCYSMIIKNLLRGRSQKKNKAVKLIFAVMVVFFFFWTPYNVVLLLHSLQGLEILETLTSCRSSLVLDYSFQVSETIAFVHCCLNPIIYVFLGEKFRKYLKLLLRKFTIFEFLCKACTGQSGDRRDSSSSCSQSTREIQQSLSL
ncbi:C-C chemokine receptor type 4-like [Ambystoma mexicanum]|uniref:C-C chemokine receptor type 4-like n=1 Tax=Ambystoma mexicanum TaxID=8296 RepID=UPI0037E73F09